eukprot:XP_011454272.1 PREDICTED: uncharacterized protein LOC105347075 isoform X2 [Crassostrea gigas]
MKSMIGVLILCSVRVQLAVKPSVCDLMAIEYRFQCGEGFCDGPRQYCADDDVCRYCSIDLCRNPPDQCRYQCIISQLQNRKELCTTKKNITEKITERNKNEISFDESIFIAGCAVLAFIVMSIIIGLIYFGWIRNTTPCINVKNCFVKCYRCSCDENQRRKTEYITDGGEEMTSMCVPSGN